MRAFLIQRLDEKRRRFFPLDDRAFLGSAEGSVCPIEDGTVPPRQCVIWREGGRFRIRDLGPRARTLVNCQYVREADLVPGDRIAVGDVVFTFHSLTPRRSAS